MKIILQILPGIKKIATKGSIVSALLMLWLVAGLAEQSKANSISYNGPYTFKKNKEISPIVPELSVEIDTPGYNTATLLTQPGPGIVTVDKFHNIFYTLIGPDETNYAHEADIEGNTYQLDVTGTKSPFGFAIYNDTIYVSDTTDRTVTRILRSDGTRTIIDGFTDPRNIIADLAGNIYVNDAGTLKKIVAGTDQAVVVANINAVSMATNRAGDLFIVVEGLANAVRVYPADGSEPRDVEFADLEPKAIAFDFADNLYIASGSGLARYTPFSYQKRVIDTISYASLSLAVAEGGQIFVFESGQGLSVISPSGGFYLDDFLPAGLVLDEVSGVISGTPTEYKYPAQYNISAYSNSRYGADVDLGVLPNMDLDSIKFSAGVLTPRLQPGIDYYSLNVTDDVNAVTVTPYNSDPLITMTVNDVAVASGETSVEIPLSPDDNTNISVKLSTVVEGREWSMIYGFVAIKRGQPTLSYEGPNAYNPAEDIRLDPTSSDVAEQAYNNTPTSTLSSSLANVNDQAIDTARNFYVINDSQLYKVAAGDGEGTPLNAGTDLQGVAIDGGGNIYVTGYGAGPGQGVVKKLPAGGGPIETLFTGLAGPTKITVDNRGIIYVVCKGQFQDQNNLIRFETGNNEGTMVFQNLNMVSLATDANRDVYVSAAGHVFKVYANGDTPFQMPFILNNAWQIAVDNSNDVYVIDGYASDEDAPQHILKYSVSTEKQTELISPLPTRMKYLNIDALGYINIQTNGEIQKFKPLGGYYSEKLPVGLSIDNSSGTISGVPKAFSPPTDYKVTAYNPIQSVTAVVNIAVAAPIAILATLTTSGVIEPAFHPDTTNYTVYVTEPTGTLYVYASGFQQGSTLTIDGEQSGREVSKDVEWRSPVTTISIIVTAIDGVTKKVYTVTVKYRSANTDVTFTLSPNTNLAGTNTGPADKNYKTSVGAGTTSIRVKPKSADLYAVVRVNGDIVPRNSFSVPIALTDDITVINIECTAQDGVTRKTYSIAVSKTGSNNADVAVELSSKSVLLPTSGTALVNYKTTVDANATSIRVIPTSEDKNAVVRVNGEIVPRGSKSQLIELTDATTIINMSVTAQDGKTIRTYTIKVSKTGSNNAKMTFSLTGKPVLQEEKYGPEDLNFSTSVAAGTASVLIVPTAEDPNASIFIDGNPVANKTASQPIILDGPYTAVYMRVLAQDGITQLTYSLVILREGSNNARISIKLTPNAKLAGTNIGPAMNNYTTSVSPATTTLIVKPTAEDRNATVTVNGDVVARGSSASVALNDDGVTVINLRSVAEDGYTEITYAIVVSKNGLNNADLDLQLSPAATLTQVTPGPAHTNYRVTVPYDRASVRVIPTAINTKVAITVNDVVVVSKKYSAPIALTGETTVILVRSTAQDGVTRRTYSITVTKEPDTRRMSSVALKPTGEDKEQVAVKVNSALSPNGDGINDYLAIAGIEAYPVNKLSIMNSKGAQVFSAENYDNSTRVFDGHASNGQQQSQGTYYYMLEYNDGKQLVHQKGYIILKY